MADSLFILHPCSDAHDMPLIKEKTERLSDRVLYEQWGYCDLCRVKVYVRIEEACFPESEAADAKP